MICPHRMRRTPITAGGICWSVLFGTIFSSVHVQGNEVYLKSITIFKTHDTWVDPRIYFTCKDDDREKAYLKVSKTNRTYDVPEESVALTHITSDLCRSQCAIYDEDLIGSDDLFGQFFAVCDGQFNSETHIATITVPGEVTLELYCPECNPSSSVLDILDPPTEESHSGKRKNRQLPVIVTAFVTCGVLLGFLLGLFVHKVYRAWVDVEAEEKRREFQALYADPHTEIEDLPTDWPKSGNRAFESIARAIRDWTVNRNKQPARPVVAMQQIVLQEDPDEA
eukprot:jgi/Ulvmu1/7637/UM038_0064.1